MERNFDIDAAGVDTWAGTIGVLHPPRVLFGELDFVSWEGTWAQNYDIGDGASFPKKASVKRFSCQANQDCA